MSAFQPETSLNPKYWVLQLVISNILWENAQIVILNEWFLFVFCVAVMFVYKYVAGALYRCLFGAEDKMTPNVEFRPQRTYNRSVIEITRMSIIINGVFSTKTWGVQEL